MQDQEIRQMHTYDHKLLFHTLTPVVQTSDKYIPVGLNKGIVIQGADMKSTHEEVDTLLSNKLQLQQTRRAFLCYLMVYFCFYSTIALRK